MPMVKIGTEVPEGAKAETLKGKYKYSTWAFNLQEFSEKHHALSSKLYQVHANFGQAFQATLLLRWCWFQIKPAFTNRTQKKYDKEYEYLTDWARTELDEYEVLKKVAPYERITPAPSKELAKAIWDAYGHLKHLSDISGFGNRLQKAYDYEDSKDNILG